MKTSKKTKKQPLLRETTYLFVIFIASIDTFVSDEYTFDRSGEMNQNILITNIGFLCRGLLPEYKWMNVPEAFILR